MAGHTKYQTYSHESLAEVRPGSPTEGFAFGVRRRETPSPRKHKTPFFLRWGGGTNSRPLLARAVRSSFFLFCCCCLRLPLAINQIAAFCAHVFAH